VKLVCIGELLNLKLSVAKEAMNDIKKLSCVPLEKSGHRFCLRGGLKVTKLCTLSIFFVAFAKLQKGTISFVMPVRLSIIELGYQWTNFNEI
jgi:hypothetical protein